MGGDKVLKGMTRKPFVAFDQHNIALDSAAKGAVRQQKVVTPLNLVRALYCKLPSIRFCAELGDLHGRGLPVRAGHSDHILRQF